MIKKDMGRCRDPTDLGMTDIKQNQKGKGNGKKKKGWI